MDTLSARNLGQSIADDGIRWLNFFNGRVLSAEDLRLDHTAVEAARAQLGRAIGGGVIVGFEVSPAATTTERLPVVTVQPGLAFNDNGTALELHRPVDIGLVRVDAPTEESGATFERCDVVLAATTGVGAYLLVVSDADVDGGKAPVSGLGNASPACATAYTQEGVQFRLYPIEVAADELEKADLRNRLAYRMFGQADRRLLSQTYDPFGARDDPPYGELDDLRASCFGASGVALALLFWRPGHGIEFVDMWSVRRRATPASPATSHATPVHDRLLEEGEARFLQFCDHIDAVRQDGDLANLVATTQFTYLPPAGVLPLSSPKSYDTFFSGLTYRPPVFIEGAHLADLLRESLLYPPIEVGKKEAIWLYFVRENSQRPRPRRGPFGIGVLQADVMGARLRFAQMSGVRSGGSFGLSSDFDVIAPPAATGETTDTEATASCVVFTTGHMPYRGDARFDLAYWNYANHAEIG